MAMRVAAVLPRQVILLAGALIAAMATGACATPASIPPIKSAPGVGAANPSPAAKAGLDLEAFKIGFRIAVIDCSDCHAIDQRSNSPDPRAPPLRDFVSRYGSADLAASLIVHAAGGQGGMPAHRLNQEAADALAVYLRVIGEATARPPVS